MSPGWNNHNVTRERRRHRRLGNAKINVIGKVVIRARFNVVRFGDLKAWIADKWTGENRRLRFWSLSRVKFRICGRRERILGMRVAVSELLRISNPTPQRKVKVCTEAATSWIDRSWIKFLARPKNTRMLWFTGTYSGSSFPPTPWMKRREEL